MDPSLNASATSAMVRAAILVEACHRYSAPPGEWQSTLAEEFVFPSLLKSGEVVGDLQDKKKEQIRDHISPAQQVLSNFDTSFRCCNNH